MSLLLASPLYLSTITIGRKFGQQHAERALCCRLQDFVKDESRPGYLYIIQLTLIQLTLY